MRNFTFRKLRTADLPLMQRWLEAPHVKVWWPGTEERLTAMLEDIEDPKITMLMVSLIDHPFAYIHDYDARAYGQPQFADLPGRSRVMDSFVGDPGFMGQGHAAAYIEARVRMLRVNYPMIAVGPNAKDMHAISVYSHAGFRKRRLAAARDGRLVEVMTHI